MAWYAELKRRRWYCINGFDIISWYSQYLYDEWYNSLTDEQKEELAEAKRRKEEERKREVNTAIMKLAMMTGICAGISNHDKYHGVYDEFGFPIIK